MNRHVFILCLMVEAGIGGLCGAAETEAVISPEQERFFEERIRPVLVGRCVKCHGPEKQESSLRLDGRAALMKGGDSGSPGAISGKPNESLLVQAVRHLGDLKMPPDGKLPDDQVAAFTDWVQSGLPWPKSANVSMQRTAVERAAVDRREHWAYQPVTRPNFPIVKQSAWPYGMLDQLVLAKLEASSLSPSPEADAWTLVRRANFDLLGLPPTFDEATEFTADSSPDAFARVLDRLLASPRYGERWGRHWLDVARYGDTKGYAFDKERRYPFSYTYRDYVIRALNEDLPYDQFVLEQLAADKLPLAEDKRQLAALGFLTTGRKFNNGADDLDDKIDVVCRGLLGLTVACARCHDHKFDAIPTEDYYSLYGVFASSREPDELPLIGTPAQTEAYAAFEKEMSKLRGELEAAQRKKHAEIVDRAREKVADYLVRSIANLPEGLLSKLPFISLGSDDLKPKIVERWKQHLQVHAKPDHPVFGPWIELVGLADKNEPGQTFVELAAPILMKWQAVAEGTASSQINPLLKAALSRQPPQQKADVAHLYGQAFSEAYTAWRQAGGNAEAETKLTEPQRQLVQILISPESPTSIPFDKLREYLNRAERNEQTQLQKKIEAFEASSPAAPPRAMIVADHPHPHNPVVFIRGNPGRPGKQIPRQFLLVTAGESRQSWSGSGRLELAQAIVAPDNPLTRRVLVNRVWMNHFGEPLVSTPSDFGIRTSPPPQRDALEFLAARFLEQQWSLKALHREIMFSATYRQASLDRTDARNIDSENRLLWRTNRRRLEFEPLRDALLAATGNLDLTMFGRSVELTKPPFAKRRAVFGFVDRQDLPNLFRVFDFASPDQSNERRPRTTVPQQALFLMNSPFVSDQARALVARPEITGQLDSSARITALYRQVFARLPATDEIEVGLAYVSAGGTSSEPAPAAWEQFAQLLLLTNEFAYVD